MSSKSQIIATISPTSQDKKILAEMISHQMDVARLNFSWDTHESHAKSIRNIREVSKELGRKILIIQDLSGPRIQGDAKHEFDKSALEVVTKKDLSDLKFGLSQDVDYIAMSYVGGSADVLVLKDEIKKSGRMIRIISKIERKIAIENLDEILEVSDAIMIARGDLGNEVPLEQIPFIQKRIIDKCKKVHKPVITATQMLLSMVSKTEPTRAEVTDVAFAILSGSDAVMLSDETANGKYPVMAVEMMEKIVKEAEKYLESSNQFNILK